MLYLTRAINLLENGELHSIKFITAGSVKAKRDGGYEVEMLNCKVLSSNNERQKFNIKSMDSGQIRWVSFALLTEVDGIEIFI